MKKIFSVICTGILGVAILTSSVYATCNVQRVVVREQFVQPQVVEFVEVPRVQFVRERVVVRNKVQNVKVQRVILRNRVGLFQRFRLRRQAVRQNRQNIQKLQQNVVVRQVNVQKVRNVRSNVRSNTSFINVGY